MAKKSIGSFVRKKLSDITNSQVQGQSKQVHTHQEEKPLETCNSADKDCIQQLLKERMTLMKLLAEKNKMLEWSGAEMQMLRANVQKLQLQNWNLAQSNTHMLAELNLGRERIKALQHEILWRAALLKGNNTDALGKLDLNYESRGPLPQPQIFNDGDEKAGKSSPKSSGHKQTSKNRSRRCIMRKSISSPSASSTKNSPKTNVDDKRGCLRRQSGTIQRHEGEPLENLFELEDANYVVIQPRPNSKTMLSSRSLKHDTGEGRSPLRKDVPIPRTNSFRIPLKKSANKDIGSSRNHSAKSKASGIH